MILWDALTSYMILGVGAAGSTNIGEKSRDVNYSRPGVPKSVWAGT